MQTTATARQTPALRREDCLKCEIWNSELFPSRPVDLFEQITQSVEHLFFQPQERLYASGAGGEYVFSVRAGVVKLVKDLPNGGERIVRIKIKDQLLGLETLLKQPYHHTAIAITPVQACRIPVSLLKDLDEHYPGFHQQVIRRYQQMVDEADVFITDLSTGQSHARIARLLLHYFDDGLSEVWHHPAREDLASMLGITIETTSRLMAEFKRNGYINEENGRLSLRDVAALKRLAED